MLRVSKKESESVTDIGGRGSGEIFSFCYVKNVITIIYLY
jgi:hypothetical protein